MIREVKKTDYPILVDIWESAVLRKRLSVFVSR